MKRTTLLLALSTGIALLLPTEAQAHLVNTGFGPFYNGVSHLFVNPTDLMSVLALALLAGGAGPQSGRHTLFALTGAWMAGLVIGQVWWSDVGGVPALVSAGLILVLAGAVAANLRCPDKLCGLLGIVIGGSCGLANGSELALSQYGPLALVGIACAVFVVTTMVTALAVRNDHGWRRILVQVAGSWIAAVMLLLIGWELRAVLTH